MDRDVYAKLIAKLKNAENALAELQKEVESFSCDAEITTADTQKSFYYTLPEGIDNTYKPIVSLDYPHNTADYTATVFATITDNKLRIGIKASVAQQYHLNVMFVKSAGSLTEVTT